VVTADGSIVKASPFSNPTLFIALRGGGSAFGVVLEVVITAYPAPNGFVGIFGTFDLAANVTEGSPAWEKLLCEWIKLQPALSMAGPFAGYRCIGCLSFSATVADSLAPIPLTVTSCVLTLRT
jgi:FAD/FMN-containing dehydrogenase